MGFFDYSDMNYNLDLKRFLRKNIDTTEWDFINSEILNLENLLKNSPQFTDEYLLETIESKYTTKQKADTDYKKIVLRLLENEKTKLSRTRQLYLNKIEDLKIKKNRLPQYLEITNKPKIKNTNPFPEIFVGDDDKAFNVFNDFAKEIVTDFYLDYSFIFQMMISKKENLIIKRYPHLLFMKWLFDKDYIKDFTYDDFIGKASFTSKANRSNRPTRYYVIKARYFSTDSEKSE